MAYMGGWMWLWWLLLFGGLLAVTWGVARAFTTGSRPRDERTPREILDRRYARGELTTEEYQERLRVLGGR
jgi:putative membrane protein